MSIVITGATGHLGQHAVQALLDRGVPAGDIVATGRNSAALDRFAAAGVQVRRADYDDPASLKEAFAGAEKLLLISSSEIGQRVAQHQNALNAALDAGVELLAYTSIPKADTSTVILAAEHKATEEIIRTYGIPAVLLRNSWYLENYTAQIPTVLQAGAVVGAAADGRVSAATRADYAEAAVATLLNDGHAGKTYELGGDEAFTMSDYAAALSELSGRRIPYKDLPVEEYTSLLEGFGLPRVHAEVYADSDAAVARGELLVTTGHLSRLLNRPTISKEAAIRSALAAL
jgi:NAD(P)H dehydrogenase (quinone)